MSNSIKPRKRKDGCAIQRLKRDYFTLINDPIPYIQAHPLPNNILEWHYVVRGPENTPYEKGIYHGYLNFSQKFPFTPPRIYMLTPNGRFQVNTKLCLSMSDFHPETWNPAWSVSTILTGLLSFMLDTDPTYGSINTSEREKKMLAKASLQYNLKNNIFCDLFPELVEEIQFKIANEVENKLVKKKNFLVDFILVFMILFAIFLIKYMLNLIN